MLLSFFFAWFGKQRDPKTATNKKGELFPGKFKNPGAATDGRAVLLGVRGVCEFRALHLAPGLRHLAAVLRGGWVGVVGVGAGLGGGWVGRLGAAVLRVFGGWLGGIGKERMGWGLGEFGGRAGIGWGGGS